ncbi:MAG: catalase family protein [Byssovorax sp.]
MSPATDWSETIPEGEDAALLRLAETLRDLQRARAKGKKADRGLHAKSNLNVEAELTVLTDLPAHAQAGLFAKPGSYRAYVRFSNGGGKRQGDAKPDVRGVAIKVLGVPGKKLIPGMEDETTQDFLLIRSPSTPFANADDFVALVRAVSNPLLALPRVIGHFGFGRGLALLKTLSAGLGEPMTTLASTRYFSAVPIKYGPYAVHVALTPHEPRALSEDRSENGLGDALARTLRERAVTYDVQVQFYVDRDKTPIEDASVEWKESDAPFVTVGRLTLTKQDVSSARGKALGAAIEELSFDPWHALEDHRPLGNMMRARNHAYRLSTAERKAAPEPKGPLVPDPDAA